MGRKWPKEEVHFVQRERKKEIRKARMGARNERGVIRLLIGVSK